MSRNSHRWDFSAARHLIAARALCELVQNICFPWFVVPKPQAYRGKIRNFDRIEEICPYLHGLPNVASYVGIRRLLLKYFKAKIGWQHPSSNCLIGWMQDYLVAIDTVMESAAEAGLVVTYDDILRAESFCVMQDTLPELFPDAFCSQVLAQLEDRLPQFCLASHVHHDKRLWSFELALSTAEADTACMAMLIGDLVCILHWIDLDSTLAKSIRGDMYAFGMAIKVADDYMDIHVDEGRVLNLMWECLSKNGEAKDAMDRIAKGRGLNARWLRLFAPYSYEEMTSLLDDNIGRISWSPLRRITELAWYVGDLGLGRRFYSDTMRGTQIDLDLHLQPRIG